MCLGRILLVLATATLAGCMNTVTARVERFDLLPSQTTGKTIYFFPSKAQEGSAEFAAYGRSIASRLAPLGFREVGELAGADYAILLNYGISGSRTVSEQIPIYGPKGGGTTFQTGSVTAYGTGGSAYGTYSGTTYTAPTYGVIGMRPRTTTHHGRFLVMKMVDVKASTSEKLVAAYEGQVTSEGEIGSFAALSECLFDALFSDFRKSGAPT